VDKVLLGWLVQVEPMVRMVGKVLLVWLVLLVPPVLLVSRVLRARREAMEQQVRQARQARQARLDQLAHPVSKENRGPLVRQEWPDSPAHQEWRDQ